MQENLLIRLRNQAYRDTLLLRDYQQNNNDYAHRNRYEKFSYHFINSENGRKEYCKHYVYIVM
ncbi:hypothetical protein G9F31_01860 [Acinetobacter sp. 187]|uniref:Uncharacterized protein n=1 Tax=Acinetobacter lanii TaxID=2715163 RepID=A0A6G8S2T4_9GAMM|nr:hypothetical protein [Acinetobacter lanii]NHC02525.1 hypothetical protein [Acinetobacter lanii]QIO08328.1 hypothetical protein G8D99_04370 [Acinetobacter lanii]